MARARLEAGNTSNVKRIGTIAEYRIDWGPGYRIYLAVEGNTLIILLGGGTKQRQRSDIRRAKALFEEYSMRKADWRSRKERGGGMMLTHDSRRTIVERVRRDPEFARALLDEAVTLFLNGEAYTARLTLRDLVNATVGFEGLARGTGRPAKSLHRMLSENGNPSMDNLAAIFCAVRKHLGVDLTARTVEAA